MGTTTFSGPIKAGTIKHTTGSTLGTDMANVGQVVMSQTFAADLSGGALAAQVTDVAAIGIHHAADSTSAKYAFCHMRYLNSVPFD